MWNPYDAGLQSGAGGAIWHPALKANASIDPDSVKPPLASRPALDHAAPPESNRKCVPAVDKLATSLTNKHNALPGHDLVGGSLKTNAGLNRKVKTTPHPPAPATSTLSSLWQRRRLRDMPAKAPHGVPHGPTLPAGNLPSWRADNDFGEVPHLSPRRPLRDVSSKSGLRVVSDVCGWCNGSLHTDSKRSLYDAFTFATIRLIFKIDHTARRTVDAMVFPFMAVTGQLWLWRPKPPFQL